MTENLPKKFCCTYGSCTKSFSRAEHLHRHALNHNDGNGTTCTRCSAVFKRKDLLDRHMARHKEKDEEAGGEGLGKLLTRKRLWRDSNGVIIADRRPEHEKKRKRSSGTSQDTSFSTRQTRPIESNSPPMSDARAPLSPPTSDPTGSEANGNSRNAVSVSADDQWPMPMDDSLPRFEDTIAESFDFLCNGSWGNQLSQGGRGGMNTDSPYDNLFSSDAATSFNMPIPTMAFYNWLFEYDLRLAVGIDYLGSPAHLQSTRAAPHVSNIGSLLSEFNESHREGQLKYHIPHRTALQSWTSDSSSNSSEKHDHAVSKSAELLLMLQSGHPHPSRYTSDVHDRETSGESVTHRHGFLSTSSHYPPTPTNRPNHDAVWNHWNHDHWRRRRQLPAIDQTAREAVLSLVDRAQPKSLDGVEITRNHPFLTTEVLQQWSDLFFRRFNVSYPLLHQATFEPAIIDPLLLMAILLLGATYSSKDHHSFSISIHDVMRAQIFGRLATTRPPLWMLQTILLVECFGKSRSGQLQHDMSHIFHSLLIDLIRRSDCQSARCREFNEGDGDLHAKWREEVEAEQQRRLMLLCFMWDTQHAVLFSQSLVMNVAELNLSLPWDSALWEADTAEEWNALSSRMQPPPSYLSVLKSYITPGPSSRTPKLNGLSRVLMLHGLMAVVQDLKQRDHTSLGTVITNTGEPWQSKIAHSYDIWKSDFDNYGKEVLASLDEASTERDDFQKVCTAYLAIYHAAHILLHIEISDLQVYAGAGHILGRVVTKVEQDRSRRRVERWAQRGSIAAAKAGSHAARMLRDGIRKLRNWDVDDMFHYPMCLYLATLTCWAFQVASKAGMGGENMEHGDDSDDDDADWDSRAEMNALVSAMSRSNEEDLWRVACKYRTSDLPRVMAKYLGSVRWAVAQESMIVLRGLMGKGRY